MRVRETLQASGLLIGPLRLASPARDADPGFTGAVGSSSANAWPVLIGMKKGFFAASDIAVDTVYAQSNTGVIQQLTAGSINVATSAGLVDPIRAIDKGAPIALVRIELQAPPYPLLPNRHIKAIPGPKANTTTLAR